MGWRVAETGGARGRLRTAAVLAGALLLLWAAGCSQVAPLKVGEGGSIALQRDRSVYVCVDEKDYTAAHRLQQKGDLNSMKELAKAGFYVRGGTRVRVLETREAPHWIFRAELLDGAHKGESGWVAQEYVIR